MHEVITDEDLADERLAELARAGEGSAFNQVYERWFEHLYDFAARILLDRTGAPAVVRRGFAATFRARSHGRQDGDPVLSVYAAVREAAIRRSRRRRRGLGSDADFVRLDESRLLHPDSAVPDVELIGLVWDAAAALPAPDYALLDLHLRQELTAAELARMLDVSREVVCARLAELREALDAAVLSVDLGGEQPVSAIEVFGALALVPAPAGLREAMPAWKGRRRGFKVIAAVALAVAVLGGAAAGMTLVGDDDPVLREPGGAHGVSPSGTSLTPDGSSPGKAARQHSTARAKSRARRRRRGLARKTASSAAGTASVTPAQVAGGAPKHGSGGQRRSAQKDQTRSSSPHTKRESATDSKPSPTPEPQPAPSDPAPQQEVLVPQDSQPPSAQPPSAPAR